MRSGWSQNNPLQHELPFYVRFIKPAPMPPPPPHSLRNTVLHWGLDQILSLTWCTSGHNPARVCTAMLILLREEKGVYHTVSSRVSDSQLRQVEEGGAQLHWHLSSPPLRLPLLLIHSQHKYTVFMYLTKHKHTRTNVCCDRSYIAYTLYLSVMSHISHWVDPMGYMAHNR